MTYGLIVTIALVCGMVNSTKVEKLNCVKQVNACMKNQPDDSDEMPEDYMMTCIDKLK